MDEPPRPTPLDYRPPGLRNPRSPLMWLLIQLRVLLAMIALAAFAYAIMCAQIYASYGQGPDGGDVMRIALHGIRHGTFTAAILAVAFLATFVPWRRPASNRRGVRIE